MKKTLKLFGLVALSAFVFSCTKETALDIEKENITPADEQQAETPDTPVIPATDGGLLTSFGVTFEGQQDADTKVTVNLGNGTTAIENGDEVLVYVSASNKAVYAYNEAESKFELSSGGPVTLDAPASVFYPATEFDEETGVFTMPAAVTDLENLGDKAPMAGQIEGSAGAYTVDLKNLASVLKVGVTGATTNTLTSVTLAATGKSVEAGAAYTVDFSGDRPVLATEAADAASSMEVSADGAALSGTAQTFFFLVPAGLSLGNVTVTATLGENHNGGNDTFSVSQAAFTPEANKISGMSFYAGLFSGGAGTSGDPYIIANARDFKYISKYCAEGYTPISKPAADFRGATYKQTADINFKGADLSAYMIGSDTDKFVGAYDGKEYSLSNFSITGTANYTGLWRYADGATFSNIRIQGANLTSANQDTGIIAGRADNSTISNCIATTTTVNGSNQRTGGLFGMVEGGSLTGCVFGAETAGASDGSSVTGGGNTGGLVGLCNTNMTNCSNIKATVNGGSGTANGGVAGSVRAAVTLKNCTNSGAVNASKDYNGGIVGYATVAACTLDGCSNSGNVTAGTGNKYIGGVVGMINIAGVSISNCTNSGSVSKGYDIGGIVGYVDAADIDITSCVNSGSVTAQNTSNNSCAGGIVGWSNNNNVTIVLCDNNGAVTASRANVGGIVGEIVGGKIDRCTNRADVKITDSAQNNVGGVGGYVHGTTYIKRCYSGKVTIKGGTRIGGIVGNLIDASQIVNCAVFSQIRGARTGAVGTHGIGTIAGSQSGTSLIANCLARDNGVHVQNTGSDTQLAGGIVGFRNGGTLQNCYTAGVLNNIRSKSKNGPALGAYVGQVCGKSTAGTIKDCYYRGHSQGARALGTATSGTTTDNVTLVSTNETTGYSYTTVPVEVTTSTGTQYAANTVYLKDLLNGGLTGGGISGYTPEEGEDMTWTDHILGTGYEGYPFPSALATLGSKFYDN